MPAANAIRIGWKTKLELRHAEVELALEGREADQEAAGERDRRSAAAQASRRRSRCAAAAGARAPSTSSTAWPTSVQRGAADQHQVRRAPQRHVLAEQPVPDVVEREADQREAAARGNQDAAERRVPVRVSRIAVGHGFSSRTIDEAAGGEDAEQAEQDQVVRGVGERAGVAALVDVQGDVPVHAEQRDDQRDRGEGGGERDPAWAGRPTRAANGRPAPEQRGAAGAVGEAEPEQDGGGDAGAAGGADDLAQRGAARGVGGCEQESSWSSYIITV